MAVQITTPDPTNPYAMFRNWECTRDHDGHREYSVQVQVKGDATDGPYNAMHCPGLPIPGTYWNIANDQDLWAWLQWDMTCQRTVDDEANEIFKLGLKFSTKPMEYWRRQEVGNPLLEPPKVKTDPVKYTEEAASVLVDPTASPLVGIPPMSSSMELVRGPQAEFDKSRWKVTVELPIPVSGTPILQFLQGYQDAVNDQPLWGMGKRCVKLSQANPGPRFILFGYEFYWVTLEFELRYVDDPQQAADYPDSGGFDRYIQDEGTRVLRGHWGNPAAGDASTDWILEPIALGPLYGDINPTNPAYFKAYTDQDGHPCKVVLSRYTGATLAPYQGYPSNPNASTATGGARPNRPLGRLLLQKYPSMNLLALGIPTTI